MARQFGLIGASLKHSFSKQYFTEKFEKESIKAHYELFELQQIQDLTHLLQQHSNIEGLNVTIPYKESVMSLLDELDSSAQAAQAVNVIKIKNGKKIGYNSDMYGFEVALLEMLNGSKPQNALILGTGGASKAVAAVLKKQSISYQFVSRNAQEHILSYEQLDTTTLQNAQLIVNTTPLGMYPNINAMPPIPYEALTTEHFLFDLVYNPTETAFMQQGLKKGCQVKNGLQMLYLQAEKAWQIWNNS
jgi:shikimate dehydrogenase